MVQGSWNKCEFLLIFISNFILVVIFGENNFTTIDETNPKDQLHYKMISLSIKCDEDFHPFNQKVTVKKVEIFVCNSSTNGYQEASYYKDVILEQYNISSDFETLYIIFCVKKNTTNKIKEKYYVRGILYGKYTTRVRFVIKKPSSFNSGHSKLRADKFKFNTRGLREFSFIRANLSMARYNSDGLFNNNPTLKKLVIEDSPLNSNLLINIIHRTTLFELTIRNCQLYELPDNFILLSKHLVWLDLSHNNLHSLFSVEHSGFVKFQKLEFLDMSHNKLQSNSDVFTSMLMPYLKIFRADHSPALDICNIHPFKNFEINIRNKKILIKMKHMKILSFSFTGSSRLCFNSLIAKNLVLFNISHSKISQLSLQRLPALTEPNFTMDLSGNLIHNVEDLNLIQYEEIKNKSEIMSRETKVVANVTNLQCDCQYSLLKEAVKYFSNLRVYCSNGVHLIEEDWTHLNCTKFVCGDCICRRNAEYVKANCSSGFTKTIPIVEGLSHLYGASNRIASLNASLFREDLIWVDVRANRISRLDSNTLEAMFSKTDRRFSLEGNPIICDCLNRELLITLRFHQQQIVDYDKLTCAGGDTLLNDTNVEELCIDESITFITVITLGSICVTVTAISVTAFTYNRYKQQIKTYFFARGWFLCWVSKSEIDENRPFDVFISFAHEDEDFVANELLPGLENGTIVYKTCVHLRDWIPGEMITTQIVASIEGSRRTLIVLSKSFAKSLWGMMEFRTAHASALLEGRTRVILVLRDDVCEDDVLDRELQLYMRSNTYLRSNDPWFWDKLRYALPHKPR